MSTWRNGKGLIKIEVGSETDVREVVKNKQLLNRSNNVNIRSIYLRHSKTTQTLVKERNEDLILKIMGQHHQFQRKPDGTLVPKDRSDSTQYDRRETDRGDGHDHRHHLRRHSNTVDELDRGFTNYRHRTSSYDNRQRHQMLK